MLHITWSATAAIRLNSPPFEPGQIFCGGFLMFFLGLLGSAVQRLLRLDKHAQGKDGE